MAWQLRSIVEQTVVIVDKKNLNLCQTKESALTPGAVGTSGVEGAATGQKAFCPVAPVATMRAQGCDLAFLTMKVATQLRLRKIALSHGHSYSIESTRFDTQSKMCRRRAASSAIELQHYYRASLVMKANHI